MSDFYFDAWRAGNASQSLPSLPAVKGFPSTTFDQNTNDERKLVLRDLLNSLRSVKYTQIKLFSLFTSVQEARHVRQDTVIIIIYTLKSLSMNLFVNRVRLRLIFLLIPRYLFHCEHTTVQRRRIFFLRMIIIHRGTE